MGVKSFIQRNRRRLRFKIHSANSLSLRKIVAARFSGVRRQRSLRPTKLDIEKAVSEGTLVPGVDRNRLAREESKGRPEACVDQN